MQKFLFFTFLLVVLAPHTRSEKRFSPNEFSVNGFRNPSMGIEYRIQRISFHAGYYPTNFTSGITTSFVKAGATYWFLPVGSNRNPSSFYAGANYLRGFDRDYEKTNALGLELGFRWMIWKGLNFRIGAIALAAKGKTLKINPTPGIGYSFFF